MRKMKKSGVEWIGDIPENSEITRLKYIGDVFGRIGFRGYTQADLVPEGEGPITLSPSNINEFGMDYSKCTYLSWDKYDESPEIQIKNGDVLMVKTGSSYGKSAIVEELPMEATINPQFVVIKNIRCNPKYLYYYMQTELFKYQVEETVVGGTIPTMAQEKINAFYIINYKEKYCRRIVEFLDKKCAEIDALIDAKEKTNALLKEQRQSIIYEAVTKGLNPNIPMKDSGIEWIGEIPENWNVSRFRSEFSFGKGLPITKADLTESGIGVVSYGQIHSKVNIGTSVKKEMIKFVDGKYLETNISSLTCEGDIIFADTSEDLSGCGNCVYVDAEEPIFAGYHTIIARPKERKNAKYYAYLFATDAWRSQIRAKASGVKLFSITQAMLRDALIILPNETDMSETVTFLDDKCSQIDTLIEANNTTIEKLKEYRKSIIFEVVTGKVEI